MLSNISRKTRCTRYTPYPLHITTVQTASTDDYSPRETYRNARLYPYKSLYLPPLPPVKTSLWEDRERASELVLGPAFIARIHTLSRGAGARGPHSIHTTRARAYRSGSDQPRSGYYPPLSPFFTHASVGVLEGLVP